MGRVGVGVKWEMNRGGGIVDTLSGSFRNYVADGSVNVADSAD